MFVGCNGCDPQIPQPVEWNPISASTFAFAIYSIKFETVVALAEIKLLNCAQQQKRPIRIFGQPKFLVCSRNRAEWCHYDVRKLSVGHAVATDTASVSIQPETVITRWYGAQPAGQEIGADQRKRA